MVMVLFFRSARREYITWDEGALPFVESRSNWYGTEMKNAILKFAALNALGTALYIALVASLFFYAPHLFGNTKDTVLIPIAMLLLFVVSASVTGSLVLGRPILWYLDGKKKEAVALFMATVGCLFLLTCIAFAVLAAFGG